MIQHPYSKPYNMVVCNLALAALFLLASCTNATPPNDDGSAGAVKCIDNKPAPTPYSTQLKAINHEITVDQAVSMINNFGEVRETMLTTAYAGRNVLPVSETFNLQAIDAIICQHAAVGFRVYMAMDGQQQVRFVLVGVDGDGKDIIQRNNEAPGYRADAATNVSTKVFETGQRWP